MAERLVKFGSRMLEQIGFRKRPVKTPSDEYIEPRSPLPPRPEPMSVFTPPSTPPTASGRVTWDMGEEFHMELARREAEVDKIEERIDNLNIELEKARIARDGEREQLLFIEISVLTKRMDLMNYVKVRDFPSPPIQIPRFLIRNQFHSI